MIIYSIMFMYIFLVGVLSKNFLETGNIKTKYDNRTTLIFAIVILSLPVFFIGMRTNYIDTKAYIEGFIKLPINWSGLIEQLNEQKGGGWIVYEWIIKRFITSNANAFLMITAIIQAGALLKLYYKYSNDYPYSILVFFLSCSFVNMMNGIRQFMAIALILYFVDYIFEKKYVKFLIVATIATTIHVSAIVWIPAVFLVQGKTWNWRTLLFSVAILLSIIYVDTFTELLSDTLASTEYSGYTDQFSLDDGSNIIHTLIAAIPVAIAYVGRNIIEYSNTNKLKILINISILGVMTSLLANFTSGILIGRMPIYFTIFNFALLPHLYEKIFNSSSKRIIRLTSIIGYILYAVYYMLNAWGELGMPYISDILGINTWN